MAQPERIAQYRRALLGALRRSRARYTDLVLTAAIAEPRYRADGAYSAALDDKVFCEG